MALCFFRVIGVVELGAQRTCLMSSFPPPLKFQTKESLPVPPPSVSVNSIILIKLSSVPLGMGNTCSTQTPVIPAKSA